MKAGVKLLLGGALLAAAPFAVAAAQNWNITYGADEGRHVVGNPAAQTQLIVFSSYTCPHCANFEKAADAPIRAGYIHSGALQLDVRHVIRNPVDLAAALLAECGAKDNFFANHRAILHAHESWMDKARGATPAQMQRWGNGPLPARMRAIADDLGFHELMAPRGYSAVQVNQCLSDEAKADAITQRSTADSDAFAVPGTPSFAINGKLLAGVHSWPGLQAALDNPAQ